MKVICEYRNICGWEDAPLDNNKDKFCRHAVEHEEYEMCDDAQNKGFGDEKCEVKVDCTTAKCIPVFIEIIKEVLLEDNAG